MNRLEKMCKACGGWRKPRNHHEQAYPPKADAPEMCEYRHDCEGYTLTLKEMKRSGEWKPKDHVIHFLCERCKKQQECTRLPVMESRHCSTFAALDAYRGGKEEK